MGEAPWAPGNVLDIKKELSSSSYVALEAFQQYLLSFNELQQQTFMQVNMAFQQHLHSFNELQQQTFKDVDMVYLEINDILNQSTRKMKSSPFTAKVTSAPKYEDMDYNSTQVMDRMFTPLTITDKMSDPEKRQILRDDPAQGERTETYHNAASETPRSPLVAESKCSNSAEPYAKEYPPVSTYADVQDNSRLKYTSYHDSQPKYHCVCYESVDDLFQWKGTQSDTEEKFTHLRKTDNNNSSQPQCMDRLLTITDKTSDTEKSEKLHHSPGNEERAEKYRHLSSETLRFPLTAESKPLNTSNSIEPYSKKHPANVQHNKYTSYYKSEPKYPFISFESDDELEDLLKHHKFSPGQLNGRHGGTEETEFGHLRITDISSPRKENSLTGASANASHVTYHAKDSLTKPTITIHGSNRRDMPSQHHSNTSLIKPQDEISGSPLISPCWSTRNSEHLRQCEYDDCMGNETTLEQVVHFKCEIENLEKQMKSLEDVDIAKIKAITCERVLKIQDLRNSLIKSDQLEVQDQRLRNENFEFQRALEQLHVSTQCLLAENFNCRKEISELRTAKVYLQLKLSNAEQDGEDCVHDMKVVADKCEELLNQRKLIQDERNFLSIEKQFLMKEVDVLKKELNKKLEELASVTIERENLSKVLDSTKARLVSYTKEKQELQSKLTKALIENCLLRRKLDAYEIQQMKAEQTK